MSPKEVKKELQNWPKLLKEYQRPNSKKAIGQILNSFVPYLAIWIASYFLMDYSILLGMLLAVVNAFFLVRIFIIQHDCGHRSFLKSSKWMNFIGHFCSVFSSIPYKYWAQSHDFHHQHNGQLDNRDIGDINMLTVSEYKALGTWGRIKYRIYRMPIVMFVIGPLYYILIHQRLPLIGSNTKERINKVKVSLMKSNVLIIGVYVALAFILDWKNFLLVQLSILAFFSIIAIWFFYVQHQHEHNYKAWKENWDYVLAAIKGSTYYKLPSLFNWLTGSIGFHHIHHLNPLIPNYNLKKCHKDNPIFEKVVNIIRFRESFSFMFHKLWDEQKQRMITFREFRKMEQAGLV